MEHLDAAPSSVELRDGASTGAASTADRRHEEYVHLTPVRRGVSEENLRALEQQGHVRLSKVDKAPNMQ
eukprot:8693769-Pyramimonas_sp.AAC.1